MSRTEAYHLNKSQFDGYRNILSLLNKLNAIQIRRGRDITTTAEHISRAFGQINRARAMMRRAQSGSGWVYS